MVSTLGIEPLEVESIAGILQEVVVGVSKDICPLVEVVMDDVWDVLHGSKLPFPYLIIGLIIDEDKVSLTKGARVDMGVKMGLRPGLRCFDNLERFTMVLISLFKHKYEIFQ